MSSNVTLMGAMLSQMELHDERRLAVLQFDDGLLERCGATIDDTEGLVNLPLGAREVSAVALFKRQADGTSGWRPAFGPPAARPLLYCNSAHRERVIGSCSSAAYLPRI